MTDFELDPVKPREEKPMTDKDLAANLKSLGVCPARALAKRWSVSLEEVYTRLVRMESAGLVRVVADYREQDNNGPHMAWESMA